VNLHERAACDGLLPDEDAPTSPHMERLCEHFEQLQWELERTSRELIELTLKMRAGGSKQ
jgi:hypothetical protein